MRLRPWHLLVVVFVLSAALIGAGWATDDRLKDVLLGLGTNLLSSVVFFVLLELYWRRFQRANGKEVDGFDYHKFARNVERSRQVRVLATYILPLTRHPGYADERASLLRALRAAVGRPGCVGVQVLFLHPDSPAARQRAAERKDDDVGRRMEEAVETLRGLLKSFGDGPGGDRLEVRLYSRMPAFSLFQTDDFASISFYYRDRPVSEVARYEFYLDSPLGVFVEKTFDDLWRDEGTVRLEEAR